MSVSPDPRPDAERVTSHGPLAEDDFRAMFETVSKSRYTGCQHGPFHPAGLRRLPNPCKCPWSGVLVENPLSQQHDGSTPPEDPNAGGRCRAS